MEPLVIVTALNRKREVAATLAALTATTNLYSIHTVIMDNGSTDGAGEAIDQWIDQQDPAAPIIAHHLEENIGIPRALNFAMSRYRQPGQSVVKLDSDVEMLTEDWPNLVAQLIEYRRRSYKLAIVRAWREGATSKADWRESWGGADFYYPVLSLGYSVWYTSEFLDRAGYFDVLAPDHKYGFEDVIASGKAKKIGWEELVWEGWRVRDIQRNSSLRNKREHVDRMRPFHHARLRALMNGVIWTGPDGQP